jgi:hypothetical protein
VFWTNYGYAFHAMTILHTLDPATVWVLAWCNLSLTPKRGTTDGLIDAGERAPVMWRCWDVSRTHWR